MRTGRPELPNSYILDIDKIVDKIDSLAITEWTLRLDIDIVIPIYESLPRKTAENMIFILDNKIFSSQKSQFVQSLETDRNDKHYYIYDKFKADSYSHKKSYKQVTIEVPYVDDSAEPIFVPVYWRIN